MADTKRRKDKKEATEKVVIDRNEAIISDMLTRLNELSVIANNHSSSIVEILKQLDRIKDRLGLE